MKKYLSSIFALLIILMLTACATTEQQQSASVLNNKQNIEKLRFDDWKYKGFGQELPFWVDTAIDNDVNTLKKILPELYNVSSLTVIIGFGENADQADQAARNSAEEMLAQNVDYKYYDSFWVRENTSEKQIDMPYKALYIYYKE